MYDDVPRKRRGLELPVCAKESLYLRPGEAAVVKIEYGQANPQREVVWAGRGKRWVTEMLFGFRSWATAVRVVNFSDRNFWIDTRTALAWIVEYGHFPKEPGFVRPGKIRYKEWQQLILESTESRQGRMRAERLEQLMRLRDPPPRYHDQSISGRPISSNGQKWWRFSSLRDVLPPQNQRQMPYVWKIRQMSR
ncbi:Aspartic protease [Phytophthora megakarya]|uniref:Aspartic protease n=1 Tax=Phytophthora megakarya TaxID=4795 RepID=A0A225V1Z3_9STRA|nr:Aspartic protease [Phytophthora megakarya]